MLELLETFLRSDSASRIRDIAAETLVAVVLLTALSVVHFVAKLTIEDGPFLELLARRLKLAVGEKEDEDSVSQPRTVFVVFGREVHL